MFSVLTVGRPRETVFAEAARMYQQRLKPPWLWAWETVPAEPARGSPERALEREGARILERVRPRDRLVALAVAGELITSEELAARLSGYLGDGRRTVFVVGGHLGLAPPVLNRADWQWSLSPLTLPHELALVVLAEQFYRAWAIATGHPYHRGD
jgi:23S rRNA (pseudouridine1915-N3)-methyltransferase